MTHLTRLVGALVALMPALAHVQTPPAPGADGASRPRFALIPGPSLADANKALAAANAAAVKMGVALSCTVVDVRGDLIAATRMDGARSQTPELALAKARTAAFFGRPSGSMSEMAKSPVFSNLNSLLDRQLFAAQGGMPILRDGVVVGAIGCSGASGQQDEEATLAGLAQLPQRVPPGS